MEDFYEHIDDYMNGSLQGELLQQFESALESDASLRLAIENYSTAKDISEGLLEMDMLQVLEGYEMDVNDQSIESNDVSSSKIGNNHDDIVDHSPENISRSPEIAHTLPKNDDRTSLKPSNIRKYLLAAIILSIALLVGWWLTRDLYSHLDKERIMASIVRPVDDDATKSVDTIGMSAFEKGKYMYGLNRFEESIIWLEQVVASDVDEKTKSEGYFWLGHSYIQEWRVDEAKEAWAKSGEKEATKALQLIPK